MPDRPTTVEVSYRGGITKRQFDRRYDASFPAEQIPDLALAWQGGRSLIYAHARVGMFGPLWGAHVGQEVDVAMTDGHQLKY